MHRALLISEIVRHVCELLSTGRHLAALAALARTARVLHEPAIETLWRTLGERGIYKLVRCMPADLWVYEVERRRSYLLENIYFVRDIIPSDWDRLFFYARHVRRVWDFTLPPNTKDQFVDALLAQWPTVTLFPNLQLIEDIETEDLDRRLPLTVALRPEVRLECLCLGLYPENMSSTLKFIVDVRPPLQCLTLIFDARSSPTAPRLECPVILLDLLEALPTLKSLSLGLPWTWFSGAAVRLSSLPLLERLEIKMAWINMNGRSVTRLASHDWPPSPFPSLRRLKFSNRCMTLPFSNAVSFMWPPGFTVPSTFDALGYQENVQSYIRTIRDTFDLTGLRELHLEHSPFGDSTEHNPDWDVENILTRLLLPFVNLECLSLGRYRIHISDTLFKKVIDAWPNLKRLHIISYAQDDQYLETIPNTEKYVTLDGLSHVAASCPNLLAVTCPIDLRDSQNFFGVREGERNVSNYRNNQLQELGFTSNLLYGDITHTAKVLSTLFPRLWTVYPPLLASPACWGAFAQIEASVRERARTPADSGEAYHQSVV